MGNNRLQSRYRLFIRKDKTGQAIAGSSKWLKQIPRSQGQWVDITEAVVGCCSTTEPSEGSFIIFQGASTLDAQTLLTGIDFPGYSWTGELGASDFLVVPLPFNFAETITLTVLVPDTSMDLDTSTVQGTGDMLPVNETVAVDADPQTTTLTVTSTPGTQYLVILSNT